MRRSAEHDEVSGEAAAASGPRVFTVPPGKPFLAALAEAILNGHLPNLNGRPPSPLDLPTYTILLPTRRATRALAEAFLKASNGRAMLLPRIRPIAEADEELSLLSGLAGSDALGEAPFEIPPPVSEIERRLALTELVLRWSEAMRRLSADPTGDLRMGTAIAAGSSTPAQAASLAGELGRLMDMVETEGKSFAGLANLVPEDYSEHWQKTLTFLNIVTEAWPKHLAETGLTSPADRRNRMLEAEARRLDTTQPAGPMIVAGVTGSIPATAGLMRTVLQLPQAAVVLPALDVWLDEASWQAIAPSEANKPSHPEHPQFGLKKLLDRLGIGRAQVCVLPAARLTAPQEARCRLVSEAMRPASTTERWHEFAARARQTDIAAALSGVSLIEAPTAQDEAETIALIMRQAAETPGRTAALISPDRLLARRVAKRLEAWGIRVDDSAGRPFAKTVPGAFLDLVIAAAAHDFAPPELMALLKHPLCRLGLEPFAVRKAARALEIAAFRAPYLGRGLDGVEAALERAAEERERRHPAVRRLWQEDWEGARDLVQRLKTAFAPLVTAYARRERQALHSLVRCHVASAESIATAPPGETGQDQQAPSPLWEGEAGEAAARFFASLLNGTILAPAISAFDYADFYRALVAGENVRPRTPLHPRLFIWGPFEARLQQADVMILGSLNDGTWPESADPGPWLNRPMRAALGLPSPEERIGYAAHDFVSFLGADAVYLTRAEKVDGVPTVPSRWLMRLEALLEGMGFAGPLQPDEPWLAWARNRDRIVRRCTISAPEPRPEVELRPRRLSVSDIETWIANPYAVFAEHILKLKPLDPLGQEPGPGVRGSVIHTALARFAARYPQELPNDTARELLAIAREVLTEYSGLPRVAAFWLPRFARFANWFAETEPARRQGVKQILAEVSGKLVIEAPAGPFTLTARADRIDICQGGLLITDYKTGQVASDTHVLSGGAPQLPLEAAIAIGGGFPHLPQDPVIAGLRYIRASGGEPPGVEHTVKCDDAGTLAARAVDGLKRLVTRYDRQETPYKAVRRSRFSYEYDGYAHLARVAEWQGRTGEEE